MVILSSLKQLRRTPVKTLVFFVLLILTTAFFLLGFNLWTIADKNIQRIEGMFITIGTAEQKATSLEVSGIWDAEKKDYIYQRHAVYGDAVPISALDLPGIDYIHKPEMRPFYCAYDPDYIIVTDPLFEARMIDWSLIVKMHPLADCETGDPVPIKITNVLVGFPVHEGSTVMFCNHYEEKTYKLYADKTYIVGLGQWIGHEGSEYHSEYIPWSPFSGSSDGEPSVPWAEVTDDFYDTPRCKAWLNYISSQREEMHYTIPVIPTNYTKLLMAFFSGEAKITDGRDINNEEYKTGAHVCLIQRKFAEKNNLKVGDSLPLPLIWTSYGPSSAYFDTDGESGGSGPLDDNGKLYKPFDNDTYTIVGIYNVAPTNAFSLYALGGNAVIIPSASVTGTDKNVTQSLSPMRGWSTSFQIPNGTIDEFMAAWQAKGIDDVEITFFDNGYSKIRAGLDDMKNMALIMFTVGAVTTLFTVMLFCHLFISKQRRRTAIERSLGLGKALCTLSMLAAVIIIVIPAYIFGSLAGSALTAIAAPQMNASQTEQAFDTTFSDWVNSIDKEADSAIISVEVGETGNYLLGAAIIPLSLIIALWAIRGNLKAEPLKLLGEKER